VDFEEIRDRSDEELFALVHERGHGWKDHAKLEAELTMRLIYSLGALKTSTDKASTTLNRLTVVLVLLTVVIAGFTIALFFKS
jgi:hypothetical protein